MCERINDMSQTTDISQDLRYIIQSRKCVVCVMREHNMLNTSMCLVFAFLAHIFDIFYHKK